MTQTSPLIIYAYISLDMVALYGNYQVIILGVNRLCEALFNSIGAGIGDLVAEGNKEKSFRYSKNCSACASYSCRR